MKGTKFMKNQTHQSWKWQGLLAITMFLAVGANHAFAAGSDCKNQSELVLDGQVKMKFCDIPAAQGVLIGSENGSSDEKPVKARNFKKFQMAQFEVTQIQYKTVTGSEPWKENGKVKSYVQESNDNPAVYVSYNDAQQFARVLSLIDKTATYRLPTEAEFEYAARAGTTTNYYWGDEIDANFAYFWGNTETTGQYARKVDSCPIPILNSKYPGYCANDFGLYHMLGNVWEWTAYAYVNSYANASTDGNVAVKGEVGSIRVMRGGSWVNDAEYLRSSGRYYVTPDGRHSNVGFRLVRIAK
ncbi:MAG: formylglycine-generating enzyme family protein [Cyclobacteriaceae bacterium]